MQVLFLRKKEQRKTKVSFLRKRNSKNESVVPSEKGTVENENASVVPSENEQQNNENADSSERNNIMQKVLFLKK